MDALEYLDRLLEQFYSGGEGLALFQGEPNQMGIHVQAADPDIFEDFTCLRPSSGRHIVGKPAEIIS